MLAFIKYAHYEANRVRHKHFTTSFILSKDDDIAQKLVSVHLTDNILITRCILFYINKINHTQYHLGEYRIPREYTLLDILDKLNRHDVVMHNVVIYRGWTIRDIRDYINARNDLSGEITVQFNEGDIISDTYSFIHPTSKNELIEKMLQLSKKKIENIWNQRTKLCTLTSIQDMKILATVISRESNNDPDEIRNIASVFYNRLKINMPLQADSVLVYYWRMSDISKHMTYREFMASNHPYNSYKKNGLPPAPIGSPTCEDLMAVVAPITTDYLYFQHNTENGDVFFSKGFARHLKIQRMLH